jgi:hypothetical protein
LPLIVDPCPDKYAANIWVDGIHFGVRLDQDRVCTLVIIGVRADRRRCRTGPRPGLRYARLDAPISSRRNTGWSLGSGSLVKHGSTVRPQTFR